MSQISGAHRFSAFWLRKACRVTSYQPNIWCASLLGLLAKKGMSCHFLSAKYLVRIASRPFGLERHVVSLLISQISGAHRFSAFWLRKACRVTSYQPNIWCASLLGLLAKKGMSCHFLSAIYVVRIASRPFR